MSHIPEQDNQTSEASVSRAVRARSFGAVAEEYERGRPTYPPDAIRWLLGEQGPLDVLDLAAGTGKLTRAILAAGHHAIAVEPSAGMRALLEEVLPQARALQGTAEAIPLADGSVDAVLVGAAFHWFDHDRALAEIVRVLRPTPAILGLLGNRFDDRNSPWVASLRELLGSTSLDRPGHWPAPEALTARFQAVEDREFDHTQTLGRRAVRDLAISRSSVATLPPDRRTALLDSIDPLLDRESDLVGHETVTVAWQTRVRRAQGLRSSSDSA